MKYGYYEEYYPDGKLKFKCYYEDDKKERLEKAFYINGKLKIEC